MGDCPFCSEIAGASFTPTLALKSVPRCHRVHQSPSFPTLRAIPDRAPMSASHVLLCSQDHISCYSDAEHKVIQQLEAALHSIGKKIPLRDNLLFFEHGLRKLVCPGCISQSSCVDHAHLHLSLAHYNSWSAVNSLIEGNKTFGLLGEYKSISQGYSELKKTLTSREYVLVGITQGDALKLKVFGAEGIPSQYIKRFLMSNIGLLIDDSLSTVDMFNKSYNFLSMLEWKI